jgi:DNA polymerase (family 10)
MDNRYIAQLLAEMASYLEFLGENTFKVTAYQKASYTVASLPKPVDEIIRDGELSSISGIGKSISALIEAWITEKDFSAIEDLRLKVPKSLFEIMKIPGLGQKRIKQIYDELQISTIEDLRQACIQGKLSSMKWFSKKIQERIIYDIDNVLSYRGRYLIDQGLNFCDQIKACLSQHNIRVEATGECRRGMETLSRIELIVQERNDLVEILIKILPGYEIKEDDLGLMLTSPDSPPVRIYITKQENFIPRHFSTTGPSAHVEMVKNIGLEKNIEIKESLMLKNGAPIDLDNEDDIYHALGIDPIPPELRDWGGKEIELSKNNKIPALIEERDIIGTIHNHTTYSDGKTPLKQMVSRASQLGYQWIGIADHSVSAYYAGGLSLKDIARQHKEIDTLNEASGITILKGIESEILPDGSLDYDETTLRQFDFVIASVHSNMSMAKSDMTKRIIAAIKNPYTSILGHPTGGLLLSREPYQVDIEEVLEQAIQNSVIIELNANPQRLDLNWRLIPKFISSGGLISIGPDAHIVQGLNDMRFGIIMARKGFVAAASCINTFDVIETKKRLTQRWK